MNRDWLVAAQLDAGRQRRPDLAGGAGRSGRSGDASRRPVRTVREVGWDERQAAVVARRERRLGALVIDGGPLTDADPEALRRAMLAGVRQLGLDSLPWTAELQDWRARIASLRHWFPEEDWPDLSDAWLAAHLAEWLEPWLDGVTRREHLQRLDLTAALARSGRWPLAGAAERTGPDPSSRAQRFPNPVAVLGRASRRCWR